MMAARDRRFSITGLIFLGLLLAMLGVGRQASATSTFFLHDHPDGNARPPLYGLRLDGLDGTANKFTFDFDNAAVDPFKGGNPSAMRLVYDDNNTGSLADDTIHIFGHSYGGLDVGASFSTDPTQVGIWAIDFTYGVVTSVTQSGASFALEVAPEFHPQNAGTITPLFMFNGSTDPFHLQDEDGTSPMCDPGGVLCSFRFNNTDDHRLAGHGLSGPDTFVGWGWLNFTRQTDSFGNPINFTHVGSDDWLFTGNRAPVPEPGTLLLLGSGLAGLAAWRMRKRLPA